MTGFGLSIYHLLLLLSNFNLLHNSQWITFPTLSYQVLYSFWISLLYSLIIWFTISFWHLSGWQFLIVLSLDLRIRLGKIVKTTNSCPYSRSLSSSQWCSREGQCVIQFGISVTIEVAKTKLSTMSDCLGSPAFILSFHYAAKGGDKFKVFLLD